MLRKVQNFEHQVLAKFSAQRHMHLTHRRTRCALSICEISGKSVTPNSRALLSVGFSRSQTMPSSGAISSQRWMLPPTQILIQTSACLCPDASLSRPTITVAVKLSAASPSSHTNILAIPWFVHCPLVLPIELALEIFIRANYFVLLLIPGASGLGLY